MELKDLLEQAGALVPVPASAPPVKDGLWVSEVICQELLRAGVGDQVRPLLTRVRRVQKSSTSSDPEDRPDPTEHATSMVCERELLDCTRLTLVDDVVTRGSTMMGCILKLRENYPDIEVQGFALARVEEAELQEPSQMLSPKLETVTYTPDSTPILVRR